MSETPKLGRNARFIVENVVVAYARNLRTGASSGSIEAHSMDSRKPLLSEPGNITFNWSCDKLATESQEWLNRLINGDKFSIVFAPTGTPKTAPYETWTGCYVTDWDKTADMTDGILLRVSGKALDVTPTAG